MSEAAGFSHLGQDEWEAVEGPRQGWIDMRQYPVTDPDEAITAEELAALRSALHDDPATDLGESSWHSMLEQAVAQPEDIGLDDAGADDPGSQYGGDDWPIPGDDADDGWQQPGDDHWAEETDPGQTPWG